MHIRINGLSKTAMAVMLIMSTSVIASMAMAVDGHSLSKHRLARRDHGAVRRIKTGSDYGRGYDGYEAGLPKYGAVVLNNRESHVSPALRPWGFVDGLPVYLYPLNISQKLHHGSDYEQFQQQEEEVSAPDGYGNLLTSGSHCSTPIVGLPTEKWSSLMYGFTP